jgi:hypothetical protein
MHAFQGSGQKAEQYYDDFLHYYGSMFSSRDYPTREPTSLVVKFKEIGAKCMKFTGCFKMAQRMLANEKKQSGMTEWHQNVLKSTFELYSSQEEHDFPYYTCWMILKDQPKWSTDFSNSLSGV